MCGITGAIGGGADSALVGRMSACLAHRGPDDEGIAELHDANGTACGVMAQRRLAIIDLSPGGHQPMPSADGRYSIVFNGEIYNYRELRAELARDGASFRSGSDTEVLLVGLAMEGQQFVAKLRGMFAFVFWDRAQSRALIGRDPFGIKPLYVARRGRTLAFASELHALITGGFASRSVDPIAVAAYLASGSVPEPLAMLRGATMLPAGEVAEVLVQNGGASEPRLLARYTPFAPGGERDGLAPLPPVTDAAEGARLIRDTLRDSVAHHLIADVPVALFLSGGIDSSVIGALATEVSETTLDSFTIAFEEQDFSEASFARAAATRFGTRHHEIPLSGDDFFHSLNSAFAAMDQPSMDGLNTYVVSRAVRQSGIKVVLSGLGGDELFAGYPSFTRAARLSRWWPLVRMARRPLGSALEGRGIRGAKLAAMARESSAARASYSASRMLFPDRAIRDLTGRIPEIARSQSPAAASLLQEVSWHELTEYMRNTLLRDSDVFAMANGLELRVPFVDREVVAASLAVTDALKLERGISKPLLIHALGDLLPRETWDRPKRGFALPFANWMLGPLRSDVAEALTDENRVGQVGLCVTATRAVWNDFVAGNPGMTWSRPWALYTLVRWAESRGAAVDSSGDVGRDGEVPALAS